MSKKTAATPKPAKAYQEMSLAELREATKEFDAEHVGTPGTPLGARMRALHQKVKAGRGRPKVGQGARRITTCIERGLLAEVDRFAKAKNLNRAQLITLGLQLAMNKSFIDAFGLQFGGESKSRKRKSA